MGTITEILEGRNIRMDIAVVYILIAVLSSAAGQVLLKKGMTALGPLTVDLSQLSSMIWRIGTNPYVFIGLAIYVSGTVFWLAALSRVDLSYAYPFASLSYIVMLIASWQIFNENISFSRLLGTFIIGIGVYFISRS